MYAFSFHAVRYRFRWVRHQFAAILFLFLLLQISAHAQTTSGLDQFINPLKSGLNLIVVFGFIAGCVMIMGGFLNARRDENWKMTVIYGIGVAGGGVPMKTPLALFGGRAPRTGSPFLKPGRWTPPFFLLGGTGKTLI